jgi:hypothetical protein
MATITKLDFTVSSADAVERLKLTVTPTITFTDFDRNTNIGYHLTFRLYGVDGRDLNLPTVPIGRAGVIGGPLDTEFGGPTELQVFPRKNARASEATNGVWEKSFDFEVDRTLANEDAPDQNPDELQMSVDLEPVLPVTTTFLSNVEKPNL